MGVVELLDEVRAQGVELWVEGQRVLYCPAEALDGELRERLKAHKAELISQLGDARLPGPPSGADLTAIDRFLSDTSLAAAVMHSQALGRSFVLARDEAALASLTQEDQALPVLYFADCIHGRTLGLEGLRVLLDVRTQFGPSAKLKTVKGVKAPSGAQSVGEA